MSILVTYNLSPWIYVNGTAVSTTNGKPAVFTTFDWPLGAMVVGPKK